MIENQLIDLEPYIRTVTTILLHSLWQGILIGFLAAVALSLLRSSSARIRYAICCCAMVAIFLTVVMTAIVVWPDGDNPERYTSAVTGEWAGQASSSGSGATVNLPASANEASSLKHWWKHPSIRRYFFLAWVTGVILFSGYHFIGWRRARGFVRRGTSPVGREWQARFKDLCDDFGVRRLVVLLSSSLVKVPCVIGWIKPVLLVPASMFTALDPSEIEMILVHELAHVRRYDVLVNILQTIMETVFFFNPAIWWLSRQIRTERENCCDDLAILRAGSRLTYARALANLEELRMFQTGFGSALTGTPLERRIRRIVGATTPHFYSSVLSISGMLLIASFLVVVLGSLAGSSNSTVQAGETIAVTQTFNPQPGDLNGEWEIESAREKINFRFSREGDSRIAFSFNRDELFDKIGDGQKPFQLARDAGIFFLEGEFGRNGRKYWGEGKWYFRPDSAYMHFMSRYGLRGEDKDKMYGTAVFDVSREFVSGLERYSYLNLDVDKLIVARSQGITPEYIEELRQAGYVDVPYDRLLSMRIQGATADDAREFEKLGCGHLTPDQLISARIHGITPGFVKTFRDAGFRDLSYRSFVTLRAFNLDVGDFEDCYRHRFMDMSEDNLVWVCGFGITQEDIEEIKERGITDLDTIISILAKEMGSGLSGGTEDSAVQAGARTQATQSFDPQPGDLTGEWETEPGRGQLKLRLYSRRGMQIDFTLRRDEVPDKIGDGRTSFSIVRDAGTLFLDGELERSGRDWRGEGEWYFQPDSEFVHFMGRYGLHSDDKQKVLSLAIFDVSREYISGLEDYGHFHLDVDQLISAKVFAVTPELVEEYRKAGYPDLTFEQLISLRVQGVNPDDEQEYEKLGFGKLTADELVSAKVFGVTPELVEEFREAGYPDLTFDQLISMRVQGIGPEDAQEYEELGFGKLTADELVSARVFGVTPELMEEFREAGYPDLTFDQLISMRVQGISPDDGQEYEELGFRNLTAEELVSAKVSGVTPELVDEFREAGYPDLSFEQLISMRVQGVRPEDGQKFAKLGFGKLTAEELISAKIFGITPELVNEFRQAGFHDLSFDSYVTLRVFNMDVGDFADCYRHRFMDLSEDNMVLVCAHDITQKDVEEMKELGFADLDSIIDMLAHDVTPRYVRAMSELGYDNLSPSTLIRLRNHNVTPSFVQRLERDGLKDLTPEELIGRKEGRE